MKVTRAGELVGRMIVGVKLHPFPDGRGGTAYDPVLMLDDGRDLSFVVNETEFPKYGIAMYLVKRTAA